MSNITPYIMIGGIIALIMSWPVHNTDGEYSRTDIDGVTRLIEIVEHPFNKHMSARVRAENIISVFSADADNE